MEDRKFSFIIPAHNEEKYITKTILSVIGQDYSDLEVIVVPNGCTDQTEGRVQELIEQSGLSELVSFHSIDTANVSMARNVGAQHAQGDVLLFLDADTSLEENTLNKISNKFGPKHSMATCKVKPDRNKLKFKFVMFLKNFIHSINLYRGTSGLLICHKDHFQKVGGFNENLKVKEIGDLSKRLRPLGKYSFVKSNITTSMRRYQNWGVAKATYFWSKQWFRLFQGKLEKSSYEKVR
jgi:glycosyltransferase involved in cell wall biosynthesis